MKRRDLAWNVVEITPERQRQKLAPERARSRLRVRGGLPHPRGDRHLLTPWGMNARAATFGVFFLNGAAIGVWVAQIPFVQDRFDFSKSTLGLVLLAMAVGVIVALP